METKIKPEIFKPEIFTFSQNYTKHRLQSNPFQKWYGKELQNDLENFFGPNVYIRFWYQGQYGRWIVDHNDYSLIYGFPIPYRFVS